MLDRSTAHVFVAAEVEVLAHAERERLIAEAQATARDIVAEAERAAQEIVARAVKIKADADGALDDAKSKAVCIQKRAQAALALAESIAKGRRLIDTFAWERQCEHKRRYIGLVTSRIFSSEMGASDDYQAG